jgi:hypothetical protein
MRNRPQIYRHKGIVGNKHSTSSYINRDSRHSLSLGFLMVTKLLHPLSSHHPRFKHWKRVLVSEQSWKESQCFWVGCLLTPPPIAVAKGMAMFVLPGKTCIYKWRKGVLAGKTGELVKSRLSAEWQTQWSPPKVTWGTTESISLPEAVSHRAVHPGGDLKIPRVQAQWLLQWEVSQCWITSVTLAYRVAQVSELSTLQIGILVPTPSETLGCWWASLSSSVYWRWCIESESSLQNLKYPTEDRRVARQVGEGQHCGHRGNGMGTLGHLRRRTPCGVDENTVEGPGCP